MISLVFTHYQISSFVHPSNHRSNHPTAVPRVLREPRADAEANANVDAKDEQFISVLLDLVKCIRSLLKLEVGNKNIDSCDEIDFYLDVDSSNVLHVWERSFVTTKTLDAIF